MSARGGLFNQRRSAGRTNAYAALIARASLVLDSADAVASGGTLTSWPARVGSNPTVTTAPSVDTDGGYQAVRFNLTAVDATTATNQLLTFASATVTAMQAVSSGTMVLVARLGTGQGSTSGSIANTGNSNDAWYPFSNGQIFDDSLSTTRKSPSSAPPTLTNRHCYQVDSAAGAWTSRFNGTIYVTSGTNTYTFLTGATLGGRTGRAFYGRLFAVYLFPFVLSADERSVLQSYITATWGVTF